MYTARRTRRTSGRMTCGSSRMSHLSALQSFFKNVSPSLSRMEPGRFASLLAASTLAPSCGTRSSVGDLRFTRA